jgi:RNA polymerase sigma-70 factor, ECF subfamily
MSQSNPSRQENLLVAKAQAGDLESFEALVSLYEKRIYYIAHRIVENAHDAEDILQETFLKAFDNLRRFKGKSTFYTWIVQIAVNSALQKVNKRRRHPTVSIDNPSEEADFRLKEIVVWEEDPETLYSKKETQIILQKAISSLPVIYRTVFLLKDVENVPVQIIARTVGISLPAAKSRLIRARLELREYLSKYFKKKGAPVYSADHHSHQLSERSDFED